jgi:hypothetical protein
VNWRRLAATLALFLVTGCSTVQFGYRNADTILRFQANSYLDFEGAQSEELDVRIAAFLAWHRASALPQYTKLLDEAAARTARRLTREDLVWGYDSARAQLRESLRAAATEAAPLLDRLPAEKLAHLEQRLAEDNRKFAREHLAGTPDDRRRRRLKRNLERLEDWLGGLSDAQAERVRQYSNAAPLTEDMRDRDRKRRQSELVALLRAKQASARLADWSEHWERERAPAYAAATREQLAGYFDLLLDLDKSMTPAQRAHAVGRLRSYAEDFRALGRATEGRTAR